MEEPELRDRKWFRCDMCNEEFLIERLLKDHILKVHGSDWEQICSTCGKPCNNVGIKIEKNDGEVETEETEARDRKWLRCDMCGEGFVIGRQLKDHILMSHGSDLQQNATTHGDQSIKIEVGVAHIYPKDEPALIAQPEIESLETRDRKRFKCDMCSEEFLKQRLLKDNISEFHGSDSQSICTTCGKPCSDNVAALQTEEPETRDRKWFGCDTCGEEFTKTDLLKDHILACHESDSQNTCAATVTKGIKIKEDKTGIVHLYAKKGAAFKAQPEIEISEARDRKWFGCDMCNEEFKKERLLKHHVLNSHGSNSKNKCTACGKIFKDDKKLHKHIVQRHREHLSQCEVRVEAITDAHPLNCNLTTSTARQLKGSTRHSKTLKRNQTTEHLTTQQNKKLFKCDQCDRTFIDQKRLSEHVLTHDDDDNDDSVLHVCAECHEVFKEERDPQEHCGQKCAKTKITDKRAHISSQDSLSFNVHNKVEMQKRRRRYQCAVCNKSFKEKSHLVAHLSTHSEEKPFQCTRCHKCFRLKSNLERHMFTHSDVKRYKCTDCGRAFRSRKGHSEHVLTHTGNSSFKCEICGKLFICNSRLERHVVSHSKVKPHHCTLCGKSFSQQGHLKRHVDSVHSDVKPFKCSECGKGFTLKQYLGEHLLSHFDQTGLECEKMWQKIQAATIL